MCFYITIYLVLFIHLLYSDLSIAVALCIAWEVGPLSSCFLSLFLLLLDGAMKF